MKYLILFLLLVVLASCGVKRGKDIDSGITVMIQSTNPYEIGDTVWIDQRGHILNMSWDMGNQYPRDLGYRLVKIIE